MSWLEKLRRDEYFLRRALYVVLMLGFLVRLWNLTAPIADRHSWNQVSAATVIRHFLEDDLDPLHPQWDVLAGPDTGPRVEAEEAPIFHLVAATLARWLGPLEPTARLLSIFGSLLAAWLLFRLVRRLADGPAALFTTIFFLFAPFGWYFGRTIMSDAWMLAAIILAVERFDAWTHDNRFSTLMQAALATALAGLFKPFALHIGITILLWLLVRRGWRSLFDIRLVAYALVSLVPPLLWVWWASQIGTLGNVVGQGENLLTAAHLFGPISLLWQPKFWYVLQARLFDQMASPVVPALALIALILPDSRRQTGLALCWLAGVLFYLLLVRDGNYMHNYYQLPALPVFAMLAGLGLSSFSARVPQRWTALFILAFLIISALYVRTSFYLDLSSQKAGELVRQYSASSDLILALDPGVTRKNQVIYAAHRRGWHIRAVHENTIEKHRQWGARWLATCLEDSQIAAHPEWLDRLAKWRKVNEIKGPFGRRKKTHTISIYDLDLPPG